MCFSMIGFQHPMPAHISHCLFGEDVLRLALPSEAQTIVHDSGTLFRFGCQGPDFFYHNQRTRPTALRYGSLIHRKDYGILVGNMIGETAQLDETDFSDVAAYVLGFTTHAFLDKRAHPFISYFSGTDTLVRSHAFYERILDVLLLKIQRNTDIRDYDFLPLIDCGHDLPPGVTDIVARSILTTYPHDTHASMHRERIVNAYHDTLFFYRVTNHRDPSLARRALELDRRENYRKRRLALFHPLAIPKHVDFLNSRKQMWCHPCDRDDTSDLSFPEIYNKAVDEAIPALRSVYSAMSGKTSPHFVEQSIGNESLDTGRREESHCRPQFFDPLPLAEVLAGIYDTLALAQSSSREGTDPD